MKEINLKDVAQKYNEIDVIWNENDKWHLITKKMITDFVKNSFSKMPNARNLKILNAGSAGYSYGLNEKQIFHIDIAQNKIAHLPNSRVVDIHDLSSLPEKYGLILCVGSVINYCDPIKVINEFAKFLQSNGYVIIEFENSHTLELIGKRSFNKKATYVKTFYNGSSESIWFFSETYIKELLVLHGFKIISIKRCHIFSPLVYRVFRHEKFASYFALLDRVVSLIPLLNKFSSNTIFLAIKQ
jgi:hypothetical protein